MADTHQAADASRAVRGRLDHARGSHLCSKDRDPLLELGLPLQELEQGRVVRVAVLTRLAEVRVISARRTVCRRSSSARNCSYPAAVTETSSVVVAAGAFTSNSFFALVCVAESGHTESAGDLTVGPWGRGLISSATRE